MSNKTLLIMFVFVGLALTGWIKNVIKLSECDFESPYKTEVIRGIGIIPPVGAIIGWMDIGEENGEF